MVKEARVETLAHSDEVTIVRGIKLHRVLIFVTCLPRSVSTGWIPVETMKAIDAETAVLLGCDPFMVDHSHPINNERNVACQTVGRVAYTNFRIGNRIAILIHDLSLDMGAIAGCGNRREAQDYDAVFFHYVLPNENLERTRDRRGHEVRSEIWFGSYFWFTRALVNSGFLFSISRRVLTVKFLFSANSNNSK